MNRKYVFIRKLMQRKGWRPPKMHSQITQQLTPTVITVISGFCNLGTYWCCSFIVTPNVPNAKITGHWFVCASAVLVLCPAVGLLPCQLIFSPQPGCCHVRIVFQHGKSTWVFSCVGGAPNAPGRCQSRVSTCAGSWDPRQGLAKVQVP